MMPDSTTRLLQILRTSLTLIKYYEGHPETAASMIELKKSMQHAIDDLAALESAGEPSEGRDSRDSSTGTDFAEVDSERDR